MADTARAAALKILQDVEDGAFLNLSLKKRLAAVGEQDRRFCARLANMTVENLLRIDYVIDRFTEGKRVHRLIRNILRLGVCQLLFFESVPESAAVNESVKLCASSAKRQLKGFVNAVMHNIARNKDNIAYPDRETQFEKYLSVYHSYPEWLVKKYITDYGRDFAEAMLSYRRQPVTCVRANRLKMTPEELDKRLEKFEVTKGAYAEDARYIRNITAIDDLEEYRNGEMTVQGESSMLTVDAAMIEKGDHVIDVCAAPGGKSAYAAQKQPGYLFSADLHGHRVQLMDLNFERLGVKADTHRMDAAVPNPKFYGKFDRVLTDVPCSALGLLYRKADIKYSKTEDDTQHLIEVQREILETSSRYVKPGGTLVYSTCTINVHENDENVDDFLKRHPQFVEKDLSEALPNVPKDRIRGGRLQLFPHLDGIDGFFIAALERKK
ncbi:MAG: 16S rRNA (cytosine(967)-C(5))-methyltransferase RsmB [Christensenellaceae bacterium]|nr:16S rRNA (cytosine(967)-C(5))-methyltransferase RsmB [Christensenellaceae bacterium]